MRACNLLDRRLGASERLFFLSFFYGHWISDLISFTGQCRTPMSITVEIKECSQPPTWTLSHTQTHCKKGLQYMEPDSGTGLQTRQSLLWKNFLHYWCGPVDFINDCINVCLHYIWLQDKRSSVLYWELLQFTALRLCMWTMLCEGESWGKGNVPWDRTHCNMVTHFNILVLKLKMDLDRGKHELAGLPYFYFSVFLFNFIVVYNTVWLLCTIWMGYRNGQLWEWRVLCQNDYRSLFKIPC